MLPLALFLAAQPVQQNVPSVVVELVGVSKDGRSLGWVGSSGGEDGLVTLVTVDLLSGSRQLKDVPEGTESDAAIERWRAGFPAALVEGRTSPDKSRTLGIDVGDWASGTWVGDAWRSSGSDWTMTVTKGGKTTEVASMAVADSVDVYWTRDGKHTVFVARHGGRMMRDPGYDDIVIGTDGSPPVGLALEKAKLKDADKLAGTLGKAGFTVVSVSAAQKPREKSVVYAAAGREADAQKLAAAVPGGATVEAMTWKSALPLVVAVGTSR